jgi:hypothetical protein
VLTLALQFQIEFVIDLLKLLYLSPPCLAVLIEDIVVPLALPALIRLQRSLQLSNYFVLVRHLLAKHLHTELFLLTLEILATFVIFDFAFK